LLHLSYSKLVPATGYSCEIYIKTGTLPERLIEDEKLLYTLQRMGVSNDEFAQFIKALGL